MERVWAHGLGNTGPSATPPPAQTRPSPPPPLPPNGTNNV